MEMIAKSSPIDASVSVIVPTYNRAGFLLETLEALTQQSWPALEIIVWDDGSTDATSSVCANFSQQVTYRRSENAGKSRALNNALHVAKGAFIWIVDDDDLPRPDSCKILMSAISNSGARIAAGSFVRFADNQASGPRANMPPSFWPDLSVGSPLRHILEECFIFQPGMLVHRSCYEAVGPFREDLPRSIDYEMLVRLALYTPIELTDEVVFEQREHSGSRGPAIARHEAGKMQTVWAENDRRAFESLKPQLTYDVFEAMFDSASPSLVRRAARLQRGCVFARRLMWGDAIADFNAAIEAGEDEPLTGLEVSILKRAVSGKYFPQEPFSADIASALATLRQRSPLGRQIASALAWGMAWRVKKTVAQTDAIQFANLMRMAFQLGGTGSFFSPAARNSKSADSLRERSVLREEFYERRNSLPTKRVGLHVG